MKKALVLAMVMALGISTVGFAADKAVDKAAADKAAADKAAYNAKVMAQEYFSADKLITLNKTKVAGGNGVLYGKFSFTRDMASKENAIKEIGFMTLQPGASIGVHKHYNNEDAYIVLEGTGVFTELNGKETRVKPHDITICHIGQVHALRNDGKKPLVFLDIIAQNHAATPAPQDKK